MTSQLDFPSPIRKDNVESKDGTKHYDVAVPSRFFYENICHSFDFGRSLLVPRQVLDALVELLDREMREGVVGDHLGLCGVGERRVELAGRSGDGSDLTVTKPCAKPKAEFPDLLGKQVKLSSFVFFQFNPWFIQK